MSLADDAPSGDSSSEVAGFARIQSRPLADEAPSRDPLSREDVTKVAMLARLRLTDPEIASMTEQLGRIVHYVEQLVEVNTEGVEPMVHAVPMDNVLADDVPRDSFERERILANAPSRDEECYRVPAVLGD